MELIFIGGLFPKDRESEIKIASKNIIHAAPNKLQWDFVKGLKVFFDNVSIISTPLLGNFPRNYKKLFFYGSTFTYDNISGICLGSIRLPLIGLVSKFLNLTFYLLKFYRKKKNIEFLIYSVHLPYLFSVVLLKVFNPSIKINLFINDLPQYMSNNSNIIYLFLKKIELNIFNSILPKVDRFIFVTDNLNELLNKNDKPWIRIEGVVESIESEYDNTQIVTNSILYMGTLDSRYGILDLLESFTMMNKKEYQLWICGGGELRSLVVEYTKKYDNIIYFGHLDEVPLKKILSKASILVNPRKPIGEYTKYSFPIKTLEYLATGKPCIMYELSGIPKEYHEHLLFPENYSNEALSKKILEVSKWDKNYRLMYSRKVKKFLLSEKSIYNQFNKVFNLITNNKL